MAFMTGSFIIGGITACSDDENCALSGRPMIYCSLYTINPDNKNKALNDTLDSLTVTALGTDSIIINNQKKVHKIMLPLRFTKDTTVFVLHYDYKRRPKENDTLLVVHTNTPFFQSMECGYTMKQSLIKSSVAKGKSPIAQLDTTYIRNKDANTNEIQNLELFYHYRR